VGRVPEHGGHTRTHGCTVQHMTLHYSTVHGLDLGRVRSCTVRTAPSYHCMNTSDPTVTVSLLAQAALPRILLGLKADTHAAWCTRHVSWALCHYTRTGHSALYQICLLAAIPGAGCPPRILLGLKADFFRGLNASLEDSLQLSLDRIEAIPGLDCPSQPQGGMFLR